MKIFILILCIFFSYSERSFSKLDWNKKVIPLLPNSFKKIKLHQTSIEEVKKIFGRPDLIDGNKLYYIHDNLKYAIEFIFDKNKVKEFSYSFNKTRPHSNVLGIDLEQLLNNKNSTETELGYSDSNGDLKIKLTDKTINFVRFK